MAWYVHSRPVLILSILPLVENLDKYVEIILSLTGSLYSSSYFSSMFVDVNFPIGKNLSTICHIFEPIESILVVSCSCIFIKSIISNIFRTFSRVTLPSNLMSYRAPSASSISILMRFLAIFEIYEDLMLTVQVIPEYLLTKRFVNIDCLGHA